MLLICIFNASVRLHPCNQDIYLAILAHGAQRLKFQAEREEHSAICRHCLGVWFVCRKWPCSEPSQNNVGLCWWVLRILVRRKTGVFLKLLSFLNLLCGYQVFIRALVTIVSEIVEMNEPALPSRKSRVDTLRSILRSLSKKKRAPRLKFWWRQEQSPCQAWAESNSCDVATPRHPLHLYSRTVTLEKFRVH